MSTLRRLLHRYYETKTRNLMDWSEYYTRERLPRKAEQCQEAAHRAGEREVRFRP
jgi:hypothetical protein